MRLLRQGSQDISLLAHLSGRLSRKTFRKTWTEDVVVCIGERTDPARKTSNLKKYQVLFFLLFEINVFRNVFRVCTIEFGGSAPTSFATSFETEDVAADPSCQNRYTRLTSGQLTIRTATSSHPFLSESLQETHIWAAYNQHRHKRVTSSHPFLSESLQETHIWAAYNQNRYKRVTSSPLQSESRMQ